VQDNTPAASAARELKAAARDALRMGSHWAHTALHWIDERSTDMNNRNREQEQRERAQRDRYPASGYGSDERDSQQYSSQSYASHAAGQSSLAGGRQGRDRDIQGDPGGWRQPQRGREGSYPQASATSPDDFSRRGEYGRGGYEASARGRGSQSSNSAQGYGGSYASGGYGAGSESFDDQDFTQDYSQGSSHYGSQGFGAQGSQGVYGPQGFGSQGGIGARSSEYGLGAGYGSGGYGREGYGASQYAQGRSSGAEQWRARDLGGQGYAGSTGYRGVGPKNYMRSDERIREDLNERLTDADDIDASGISVEVNNGVATLTGSVDQRWMKHRAEDLAESCGGVRDVNNQLRVTSQSGQQSGLRRDSLYGGTGESTGSASGVTSGSSQSGQSMHSGTTASASGQSGASSTTGTTGRNGGSSSSSTTTNPSRSGGSTLS